jgi:hypothetical protein
MVKEEQKKEKSPILQEGCVCQSKVGDGFKWGLGFWLSAMLIWVIVSAIVAALYYYL